MALFPPICGLPMHKGFCPDAFASAINYKPKPGDIFVASYPKCGTTWTQKIALLVLRKGAPSTDPLDQFFACPFFELSGIEALHSKPKPLAIKTHLPYHMAPISKDAKYIYICRYPLDCAVSYYYHLRNSEDITFDEYFELFISGDVPFGDYLDHLMGWYKHKDDPNVYLTTFEALKKDVKGEIMKITKFLDKDYWNVLQTDPKTLDDMVKYSSFNYLREETNAMFNKYFKGEMDVGDRIIPSGLKARLEFIKKTADVDKEKKSFLRKGAVGDWRSHFSADQVKRYEAKIAEKTAGSDVMRLWDK